MEQPDIPAFGLQEGVAELTRRVADLKDSKTEPVIVLVAGGSASGKTSAVATRLQERFADEALLVSMDDFYRNQDYMDAMRAQGVELNWDHPDMLDLQLLAQSLERLKRGQSIDKPLYDFATGEATSTERIDSRKVIIVEGLFALNDQIAPLGDLKAFVEADTHGRIVRRLLRDVQRTGQKPADILAYFGRVVEPMNQRYVDSTARNADLVIRNHYDPVTEARGMHEVQVKFVGALDTSLLRALGAERLAVVTQQDTYYQPAGRDLAQTGEALRIREENGRLTLAYKGPRVTSAYRERPKFEFEIDAETRTEVERLYPGSFKTIYKERTLYQLEGVVFSLDVVSRIDAQETCVKIGDFIEIRAINDGEAMKRFVEKVGLGSATAEMRSYVEM